MPHATTHRVLFIDAYDSFTNNIIALLETYLHVSVTTIKIDEPIANFADFLTPFFAVVAGPGPGDARRCKDVGWIRELWRLEERNLLPVLGICLGFQSLVLAFGGTIDRLGEPRHGVVRRVRGNGEGIFRGVEDVESVQYHSLYASIGSEGKHKGAGSYVGRDCLSKCSDLRPLAWDYEMDNSGDCTEEATSPNPWRVLMAVEHKSKPFFGIQFHAESICSNSNARKIIKAWWEIAKKWRRPRRGNESLPPPSCSVHPGAIRIASQDEHEPLECRRPVEDSTRSSADDVSERKQLLRLQGDLTGCNGALRSQILSEKCAIRVIRSVIDVGEATVPSICETLGLTDGEVIILDSETHQRRDVGEYSIIGLVSPDSLRLEYQIGTNVIRRIRCGQSEIVDLRYYGGSVFSYLKSLLSQYQVETSKSKVPFWGGLMGFISYEACLETIGINDSPTCTSKDPHRPDLSFVFVERSVVIDHAQLRLHVQSIKPNDQDWVDQTTIRLQSAISTPKSSKAPTPLPINAQSSLPDAVSYKSKIRACQSTIRAGESYELCLTTQASIRPQIRLAGWPLYLRLRSLNPAPFSAYVRLGKLTLLSSSPERFLQWSRPTKSPNCTNDAFDHEDKTISCQFRPIKGTVQRQPDPTLPPLTLAEATALLATPKERAENLMIVDLIRHDLHGVVGSGRVSVPKLMVVEEYATLFQLVSVIEGSLVVDDEHESLSKNDPSDDKSTPNNPSPPTPPKTGLDILAASLPPGSMTGAPKLRSCQHLSSLERLPRGLYSGVLGYLDVGGGGDFSVVIRSTVRWDARGDDISADSDEWTIGAGGAVTSLSTEDGEWEEMGAKLRSTLRLFEL